MKKIMTWRPKKAVRMATLRSLLKAPTARLNAVRQTVQVYIIIIIYLMGEGGKKLTNTNSKFKKNFPAFTSNAAIKYKITV